MDNTRNTIKQIRKQFIIGGKVRLGAGTPLALIAGPCVIESERMALSIAGKLARTARRLKIPLIFKASFDKANRTSHLSFRGPGLSEGLRILSKIKDETGLPVVTDVHETSQVDPVSSVADMIQIPALLSRQTDLLMTAGRSGLPVNVKKGQFMSPEDMGYAVAKLRAAGCSKVAVTERGTSFGYHNLVVDFRSLPMLSGLGTPVIFDATHSVQLPGARGKASGGDRRFVPTLVRAACAAGIDAVFIETHPDPSKGLSDGPNSWPINELGNLWEQASAIAAAAKRI